MQRDYCVELRNVILKAVTKILNCSCPFQLTMTILEASILTDYQSYGTN